MREECQAPAKPNAKRELEGLDLDLD